MVLEAWYFRQAGMGWSWGAWIYTRLGGTNMIQTINGCQGRRMTETTAARGGDPRTRLLEASIYQLVVVTGITVTGITMTGYYYDWYD